MIKNVLLNALRSQNSILAGKIFGISLMTAALSLGNSVVLTDQSGINQSGRPTTISRVFKQGDIPNFPRPSVSGSTLPAWQSNVMNRWPDGSVKHALITFNQRIPASGSVTVLFVNDPNPCHLGNQASCDAAAPNQSQILNFNSGSWGAAISTTANSASVTVSARAMVSAGAWRFWIKGPLVNQIIVEDRSTALSYDFGYKDKHYSRVTESYIQPADMTITVDDATDISALPMPTVVQVESEQIKICSTSGTTLNVCSGGRGYNGTAASMHATWQWNVLLQAISYPTGTWKQSTSPNWNSLHPIFMLTQYAGWPGVKEEFILENDWVTKMQAQTYDLTLQSGGSLGTTQYTKKGYSHSSGSRWRKTFWDGSQPGALKIDYNLPYMISSNAVPNFDTSKVVSASAISSQVSAFNATDKGDLGGFGQWQQNFSAVGGRPDLGIYPTWSVQYLFTFDPGLYNATFGNADSGGYVPIHFRESDNTRFFDSGHAVKGFGMPVSVDGRPQICFNNYSNSGSQADMPLFVGNYGFGGWGPDLAHQADFAYIPYLITGDWYWLEEMYFWASFDLGFATPGTANYQRHDDWGFINVSAAETRGQAWSWRNLTDAWLMSPDGDPEQAHILEKINNNIAVREGQYNITNGSFYDSSPGSKWSWGLNTINWGMTNNPLRFLSAPGLNPDPADMDATKECLQDSPWMYNLNHMVWGYMDDIGLTQIHTLRTSMGQNLLGQILDPGYQIGGAGLLAGSYRIGVETNPSGNANSCPTAAPLGPYFTDWASSKSSQLATTVSAMQTQWNNEKTDAEFGYPNILRAAASYMNTMTGNYNGATAWNWVIANADDPALNSNPKWALVPRGTSTTPPPPAPPVPPPPTTPGKKITACDLDGDGQLTPADVSVAVQQVLNPASCKTADLNKDGVCNIVDVQLLINAVNAGSCPY